MSTRHSTSCTNASCFQKIAALALRIKELELLVVSLSRESHERRLCDTITSLRTNDAAGPFVPPQASQLLSPASTPPRCPDLEPQSTNAVLSPRSDLQELETPANFVESKPVKTDPAKKLVHRFIKSIPHNEQAWRNERQRGGLMNPTGILEAFGVVASSTFEAKPSGSLQERFSNHIVKRSKKMKEALCKPDVADVLRIWGPMIFSGECRVALQLGVDLGVVNDAMNHVLNLGRNAATVGSAGGSTLKIYRYVPQWITQQMDVLYGCFKSHQHRAFEIFPLARLTISQYDKLSKPDYDDAVKEILEIMVPNPTAPEQISFPLYPPFIVWAIVLLELGDDCYNEVCQAFGSRNFLKDDFKKWYALLPTQSTPTPADQQKEATMELTHHKHHLVDVSMPEPKRRHIGKPSLSRSSPALNLPEQAGSLSNSSDCALSCDGGDTTSAWDDKAEHALSMQDSLGGNTTAPTDVNHAGFQDATNLSNSLPVSHDAHDPHTNRRPATQSLHTANATVLLLNSASGAIQPPAQNEPPMEPHIITVRAQETAPRTCHHPLPPTIGKDAVKSAALGMNVTDVYAGENGIDPRGMFDEPGVLVPLEDGSGFLTSGAVLSPYFGGPWSQGAHHAGFSQVGNMNEFASHSHRLTTSHMAALGGGLGLGDSRALDEHTAWMTPTWRNANTDADVIQGLDQMIAF